MFAAYLFSKQYIMGAIYGELRVGDHVFPILRCTYGVHQATDRRGRVIEKVRFEPVTLVLDVPRGDFLLAWAAAPAKRLPADIIFFDAAGGPAAETLSFVTGAYCVHYREEFWAGDAQSGAYVLFLTLSDPDGYRMYAGGPASSFVAPAARDHGVPPVPPVAPVAALAHTGGRGPRGLGDAVGRSSKRPYDPDRCGGPIAHLEWETAVVDAHGIAAVVQHTNRFDKDPANAAMIERLQRIEQGQLAVTDWDKRYYTHELR